MAANALLDIIVEHVPRGKVVGNVKDLVSGGPKYFRAGELHHHVAYWKKIAEKHVSPTQTEVLGWIKNKVSVFEYFRHFTGSFKVHVHRKI